MQDATHAGLKMRNRLLKSYLPMAMGKKQVSAAHLKILIQEAPKLIHGLVYTDISPDDRQKFKSLQKCMDIRVLNALRDFVPDSEGTRFFLQLCSEITSALMDHDIVPNERIEKLFHAVYFLRIWKKWLASSQYNMENFITDNAYMCIEVNASNLLILIRRFRDQQKPELFLTTLFDSQACERTFRLFRSMGTVNFTKITFTLFELLHMARRLEVQNDIAYTKLPHVALPKFEKPKTTTKIYALPSEEEIDRCLNRAKRFALEGAAEFGMEVNTVDIDICGSAIPNRLVSNEEVSEEDEEDSAIHCGSNEAGETLEFPESTEISGDIGSSYLVVKDPKNPDKDMLLRKSTLVWHLTESSKKISSDRLIRVQNQPSKSTQVIDEFASATNQIIAASQQIKVGDWCFFRSNESDLNGMFCLGMVLSFKFSSGRTAKEKKYKGDFIHLKENPLLANELEVLSSWYFLNERAELVPIKTSNHCFIHIKNYIATVVKPMVDPDTKTLFYSLDDFKKIDETILSLVENRENTQ